MRHRPRTSHRTLALLAALVVIVLTATACAGSGGADDVDAGTRARVTTAGDSAAMTLVRALGGKLNGRLASGGPAAAIEFCAGEAQAITDSVAGTLGEGWHVKRTTLQTRNPRNAPDSLEALALEFFHGAEAAGTEPEGYVQRTPSGDYRYYMPLRMGHMCLECHGPRDGLDAAVREVLDSRYPADQATGYTEGDLRGVIRVTMPAEAVR